MWGWLRSRTGLSTLINKVYAGNLIQQSFLVLIEARLRTFC
ncbi:hypothetical protein LEP1GSC170_3012 [Leptospira interrogans serovar Bataviae str. HAI135]|nr:hypothetical protein LEP1GSC170_3012 [Leptospira interrogans serovar Bataviae str. HAI135]